MKKRLYAGLVTAIIVIGMVGMAQAKPAPVPADPPCSVSDMLLNGQNADACSGPNAGNDSETLLNNLGGLFAGNPWTKIAKDDSPGGAADSGSLGGINFSVSATAGPSGTWDLTWSGALPASIDLVAVIKGSTKWSAFLFDDEMLLAPGANSPNDTWRITFYNTGGEIPALSHLSLYGRDVEPNTPVPEPSTILLLGGGLLGMAIYRRRPKK